MSATPLSSEGRARLIKVLKLLGSDVAGERAAAGNVAHRLVTGAGTTWEFLITAGSLPTRDAFDRQAVWAAGFERGYQAGNRSNGNRPGENALFVKCCEVLTENRISLLPWERQFIKQLSLQRQPSRQELGIFQDILMRLGEEKVPA